ncbi:MAG: hypothetical protein GXO32_04745 [Crenarchaeota archaeon]|nr:hypothetical protein [Thermoproteota archaeon]
MVSRIAIEVPYGDAELVIDTGAEPRARIACRSSRWVTALLSLAPASALPIAASRICGSCSSSHYLASLKAVARLRGLESGASAYEAAIALEIAAGDALHLARARYLEPLGLSREVAASLEAKSLRLARVARDAIQRCFGSPVAPVLGWIDRVLAREPLDECCKLFARSATELINEISRLAREVERVVREACSYAPGAEGVEYVALAGGSLSLASGRLTLLRSGARVDLGSVEVFERGGGLEKAARVVGKPARVGAIAREVARGNLSLEELSEVLETPLYQFVASARELRYIASALAEGSVGSVAWGEPWVEAPSGPIAHEYSSLSTPREARVVTGSMIAIEAAEMDVVSALRASRASDESRARAIALAVLSSYPLCMHCASL